MALLPLPCRRPPPTTRLTHINLARLLQRLSRVAHQQQPGQQEQQQPQGEEERQALLLQGAGGAQGMDDGMRARVGVLADEMRVQLLARAKWWVGAGAGAGTGRTPSGLWDAALGYSAGAHGLRTAVSGCCRFDPGRCVHNGAELGPGVPHTASGATALGHLIHAASRLRPAPCRFDPRYAGIVLVALGRLGCDAHSELVQQLLARATARVEEAIPRDLARIADVGAARCAAMGAACCCGGLLRGLWPCSCAHGGGV